MRLGECLVTPWGVTCVSHRTPDLVLLYACARCAEAACRAACRAAAAHVVDAQTAAALLPAIAFS